MGIRAITGADARAGWWIIAVAALAAPCTAPAVEVVDRGARILYFERFEPSISPATRLGSAARKPDAPRSWQLRFDAYGRRFDASLGPNDRLMEQLETGSDLSSLQLFAGRLDGLPQSWVRFARDGDQLRGMVWDGADLYIIEPASEVSDSLVPPLDADRSDTLVFRLDDVIIDSSAAMCASDDSEPARKADQVLDSLVQELKTARSVMQAAAASQRLNISVIGDSLFRQKYSSEQETREAILTRLNNVDGIFSSQLGIEIRVDGPFVKDASTDPLSGQAAPGPLLKELDQLRRRSPELNASGLTHLFTGRDLEGTTIGIAYVDALCDKQHGVGLTETRNTWLDSLVAAHEIGHNFGANHDGDPKGSCASTPSSGYLMAPSVSGTDSFSQCSLNRMQASAQTASCIVNLPPANVAIPTHLGSVSKTVSTGFEWTVRITNTGGLSAQNVRAELSLPPAIQIEDAFTSGGSCTSGAGAVDCELGDLPGNSVQTINLTLRSEVVGSNTVFARVSADNDSSSADNDGSGTIDIELQAAAPPPPAGESAPPSGAGGGGGQSGGGGSTHLLLVLALLGLRYVGRPRAR